ncbi:phage major capsid protein [Mesorhizobium sp. BR-1-1-8]|uniref:phage major capsid protein n=1 Tax=Mesorhizobium sp. BR-1-1-8 TaxID=2876659 RepID=UPI001CCD9BE0|nr:phage major capsid protein [Mesorhizobium sp. BR-1-1-8]MBZ9980407.1 phage major capsid protein [Mesorhizobium sp. BR-1-1-8]
MALLTELRAKQATLVAEARERLDQIGAATDAARAAELEIQHDAAMAEYDKLEARIEREEKVAGLEKRAEELRGRQRPIPRDSEARGQDDGQTIEYRHVFAKMVCGVAPDELSAEERAVLAAGRAEFRTQTAGTTTAGGFTVPTELANEIIRSMLAWGPMYDPGVATEMVTASGNPIKLPTVNDTTVPAADHTEGTPLTDDGGSDVTFGQKSLDAYAYDTEFIRWSWELDMDSVFNMEALLGSLLGERLGRIANLRLTTGSGASAPNGIVTASSLGVTAAAVGAITFDEIIDLEHSVDPAYRQSPKAAYMLNDTTLKAVRKLKNGSGDYVWQMGDVQKGVPGSLNGRKYWINQAMASPATGNKTMLFGDLSKYFVRKVGAPVIGVMRERFWPDLGIAGLIRFDGELGDQAAVKHLIQA